MNEALNGVRSFLDSKTEAALVVLEAELGVTIPRIMSEDTADLKSRQYPSLEILPDETMPLYRYDDGPMDSEAWDVHSISLVLTIAGNEPKVVEYALLYYRKVWMRIVKADNTFGGLFNRVRLGQSQYWPMVKSQETGDLLQVMRQNLKVRKYQS